MKIALGADHAGFELKEGLRGVLAGQGHEVLDLGTFDPSQPDDYPDYAVAVGRALQRGQAERGILLCGSGVGVSVAANKIPGIRAGLCHDTYSAHQGVEHDHMNVLVLGARVIGPGWPRSWSGRSCAPRPRTRRATSVASARSRRWRMTRRDPRGEGTMDEASLGMSSPPFGPGDRASGILLHVTSLPSPYGIGDLGPSAFAWVDRLARSGQSWWQVAAAGAHGVRRLALPAPLVVRGQHPPHQPRRPDRGRPPPPGRAGGAGVPDGRGRLSGRHPVQAPTARAGVVATSGPGAAEDLRPAFEALPHRSGPLAGRLRPVPGPEDPPRRRALPRLARAARPARPGGPRRGAARARRPHRPGPLRPVPGGPPGRPPPGLRPHARGPPHRRPALLRLARLGGRVGQPAVLPARRSGAGPGVVAGVPPDYFSPDGPALGQPGLRLGGPPPGGIPLVDRPPARPAGPRGSSSASTTSAASPPPGTSRPAPPRPARASGSPAPASDLFRAARGRRWAACRSSPRTSGSSRPTSASSARTCDLPGMKVLQFAFDGNPDNPFLPAQLRPATPSSTRAPTTTTRRGAGTRPCRRGNGGPSGATSADPPGRRTRSPGSCSASPGPPPPRWPWPRSRTC